MRADVVGERHGLRRRCRRAWSRNARASRCGPCSRDPRRCLPSAPGRTSFQNFAYCPRACSSARSSSMPARASCAFADRLDVAALLQDFARHVERQVVRVDHALDEAQVRRHQLLGVVHDEDALHVELDAAAMIAVPQVERRVLRDVQQLRVFAAAFDAVVRPRERLREVVRRRACRTRLYCSSVISFFGRVHSALAWLTVSSSSFVTYSLFSSSHSSFFIRIGSEMWSEYFWMIDFSRCADRSSSSSARRCSVIVVPRFGALDRPRR